MHLAQTDLHIRREADLEKGRCRVNLFPWRDERVEGLKGPHNGDTPFGKASNRNKRRVNECSLD